MGNGNGEQGREGEGENQKALESTKAQPDGGRASDYSTRHTWHQLYRRGSRRRLLVSIDNIDDEDDAETKNMATLFFPLSVGAMQSSSNREP